jgi:hypothetical protein
MQARQAIAYVQEWLGQQAHEFAGFRAAHLMGGILTLPPDGIFHPYRGIDLNIISRDSGATVCHSASYHDLIVEYTIINADQYRTSLHVLENPHLATSLARGGILADPHGILTPLQPIVAALHSQHSWVKARCNHHLQRVRRALEELRHAASPHEAFWPLGCLGLGLSSLLAESTLQAPLRRRSLVLQRKILAQHGRLELHNAILEILGWSRFRWHDVEWYASKCAMAFDYAMRMFSPPMPFQQHRRPYVVAGAQEMIEQGYCKEAMFWISRFLWMANTAIQQHAPAANRPFFQATLDRLVGTMGLHSRDEIARRVAAIEAVLPSVVAMSERLIDQYCQTETALWG